MMVLKLYMWPRGRSDRERFLGAALIDCLGQATKALPEQGIREGERAYRVRLLKMPQFGGPSEEQLTQQPRKRDIWREGFVRGHLPGKRGTWDLLGGALREMLGRRLDPYVSFMPQRPAPAEPLDMDGDVSELGSTMRYATAELPAPVPSGPEVWPSLLAELRAWPERESPWGPDEDELERFLVEMQARQDLGRQRYGQPLRRDDGRPSGVDLVQELMDGLIYAHRDLLRAQAEDRAEDAEHYFQVREMLRGLMRSQLRWLHGEGALRG